MYLRGVVIKNLRSIKERKVCHVYSAKIGGMSYDSA